MASNAADSGAGVGTVLGKRAFRRGLIVVDLPDVDSLAQEHRAIADPLMARADVVVWVTDPQSTRMQRSTVGFRRYPTGRTSLWC